MTIKEVYKKLVEFFQPRPEPTDSHFVLFLEEMEVYELIDVIAMYEHMKHHSKFFPTIAQCVAVTDSMMHNRREAIHKRIKEQARKTLHFVDPFGEKVIDLINAKLEGKITPEDYSKRIRELGKDFLPEMDKLDAWRKMPPMQLRERQCLTLK